MDAALYTRLSQDPGNDRLGVQRQERECRELAIRAGWEVQVYEDDDRSAYRPGRRPAFERMLHDLEDGSVRAIVVAHPDRLYRHPKDLERLVDVCERHRVTVQTVYTGGLDLGTASGRMVARMLGAAARHEVERMAERIRSKHQELAAAGKPAGGGSRPYGYERDRRTVVPHEAERIREAARRILAGESLRAICRDWNARGVSTVTAGRLWRASSLRKVLVAARISGRREMFSTPEGRRLAIGKITSVRAEWPAIISPAQSDRLRLLFTVPRERRATFARSHLLTGLARCAVCGELLVARGTEARGQRRIGCSKEPESRGCGEVVILAEPVERLVTEAVLRAIESRDLLAAMRQQGDDWAIGLQEQLFGVLARQQQLARQWARGGLSASEWQAAREELQMQARELEEALRPSRQVEALRSLPTGPIREAWAAAPLAIRRQIIAAVIESILLAPAKVPGRNRFDAGRVSIRWAT